MNSTYIIKCNPEQIDYVNKLVNYSIEKHKVSDIWEGKKDLGQNKSSFDKRFTGSLGEVMFADIFGLERPKRSFGAVDGQDYGVDFIINGKNIDIKTMKRKNNNIYSNYVSNLELRQMAKKNSKTNLLVFLSCFEENNEYFIVLVGYCKKSDIVNSKIGEKFIPGSIRFHGKINSKEIHTFLSPTFEVPYGQISSFDKKTELSLLEKNISFTKKNIVKGKISMGEIYEEKKGYKNCYDLKKEYIKYIYTKYNNEEIDFYYKIIDKKTYNFLGIFIDKNKFSIFLKNNQDNFYFKKEYYFKKDYLIYINENKNNTDWNTFLLNNL